MRLAVPDLISNSYFPAVAADVLGFYEAEGLDLKHELLFPVDACYRALRDGDVDFVGGSAHATLAGFPNFDGARLVASLSQGMYWFLIMRSDLNVARGDIDAVKGRNIGAAPWVELGLKRLLTEAGIDLAADNVTIAPVPGAIQPGVSFGMMAAKALEEGKLDGFWANGMGAETAIRRGVGSLVLDVRRGDGPPAGFNYTQPVLVAREDMIRDDPDTVAAAVRAIVKTQNALKADISRATLVGEKLFSPDEAAMIGDVVARDLPFYDAGISEEFVAGMNRFAVQMGLMDAPLPYDRIVATQFSGIWA
ncbi:MAG: ABC transporter substrate-binding protein [Rhodospirillales bacterium]|nr:ABC transporter substrate-binding protein [Rhodospirillales bacterium]